MIRVVRKSAFMGLLVILFSGCGNGDAGSGIAKPPGTPVSGKLELMGITHVVFVPAGGGSPHECPANPDGDAYDWTVPPGEYEVYAYVTGSRAKVKNVTVGDKPLVLDIPSDLKWEDVKDQFAGSEKDRGADLVKESQQR